MYLVARALLLCLVLAGISPFCAADAMVRSNQASVQTPVAERTAQQSSPQQSTASDQQKIADWNSPEAELRLGKFYAHSIESTYNMARDPLVVEYAARIAKRLAEGCDAKFELKTRVIDSETADAIALPGGFLFVSSGLMMAAEEEDKLAGGMAHMIAHICVHHTFRSFTQKDREDVAKPLPQILINGSFGCGCLDPRVGFPAYLTSFSPEFEAEADLLALRLLDKAGYDPKALVPSLTGLNNNSGLLNHSPSAHALSPERLRKLHKAAKGVRGHERYLVTTSDFDQIKSRLTLVSKKRAAVVQQSSPRLPAASHQN